MEIIIVTNNSHKLLELEAIIKQLQPDAKLYTLREIGYSGDIKEDADTFEGNAAIKARALASYGKITIADDSGLEVDALGGEPGVYSARYAGEPCNDRNNNEKLLSKLAGLKNDKRRARFVSCIACHFPDGSEFTVRGECPGVILENYRGNSGFGYDPLFLYEPLGKTFAELTSEEKNEISHRAVALKKFSTEFKKITEGNN